MSKNYVDFSRLSATRDEKQLRQTVRSLIRETEQMNLREIKFWRECLEEWKKFRKKREED